MEEIQVAEMLPHGEVQLKVKRYEDFVNKKLIP